jgi:hypothetical protein
MIATMAALAMMLAATIAAFVLAYSAISNVRRQENDPNAARQTFIRQMRTAGYLHEFVAVQKGESRFHFQASTIALQCSTPPRSG